ncbi:ABC transporter ATP-binding protein [Bacteroidia bacterium]|nr:ABC transporter ATP-binding protein [Bacteroidia bacterium]
MIQIDNIYKSFGTKSVLSGVSLTCETGKIQALLGVNGAGKSTLVHIISQLLQADKGEFSIDGEVITEDAYVYKRNMGYVFEHPIYIEKMYASEYLNFVAKMYELPKDSYPQKVRELLTFFEIEPDAKQTILEFSKGMKSKMSLAAALIHSPKHLILDEPFDGIDFLMTQKIVKLFKTLAKEGVTILITSHQMELIHELADTMAILKDGHIMFNRAYSDIVATATNEGKSVRDYLQECMEDPNPLIANYM